MPGANIRRMSVTFDRRSLLIAAFLAAILPRGTWASPSLRTPRILLVCQFGTVKSPVARELLKRRAAQRGIQLAVTSRGITPQDHITPDLMKRLAADDINPAAQPLRKLSASDVAGADLVIAFDRLPPAFHPRRFEDWSDLPSMVNNYAIAREMLDARIEHLLDSIAAEH